MACGPPGSGRSIGDAAPSGGEAAPGGRVGIAEGWSARENGSGSENGAAGTSGEAEISTLSISCCLIKAIRVPATFLLVGLDLLPLAAAALLAAGRVAPEGAFTNEGGAAGVKRSRHAALLLPALLPLQTGGEGTANGMAQPLSLRGG